MCGVVGLVDVTGNSTMDHLLSMQQCLIHRGPDAQNHRWYETKNGSVGLGHTRLSILDTSALGNQPMVHEQYTIILNGEIYNYKNVRSVLAGLGHTFYSHSDTEVVLHAFQEWGHHCVHQFIGMFAFAIFDSNENKLHICRDRVGVKPLFYYWNNGLFMFASEIKAFHAHPSFKREIRQDALALYLRYGYVPGPISIFEDVFKLEPAHWLIFDVNTGSFEVRQYWDVEEYFKKPVLAITYDEALHELEQLLVSSCNYRMVSDVPVGLFLSGGFDSTLVGSILQKDSTAPLKTFTIGFPDGVDEAPFARNIAKHLGTDHTSYDCSESDAKAIVPELPYYFDEPCADISAIPMILVSRLARQKVKVALSADGGDELFAGYSGFTTYINQLNSIRKIPVPKISRHALQIVNGFIPRNNYTLKRKAEGVIAVLGASSSNQLEVLLEKASGIPPALLERLLLSEVDLNNNNSLKELVGLSDYRSTLFISGLKRTLKDLLLVKVDRASMSASLEAREPLLDHRLIEYVAQLPFEFKHDGHTSKRILRDIVYKYVPKDLMNRPKTGFDLPIYKWLRGDLKYLIDEYLNPKNPVLTSFFKTEAIADLVVSFKAGKLIYQDIIWRLICFQMWHKRWCEDKIVLHSSTSK